MDVVVKLLGGLLYTVIITIAIGLLLSLPVFWLWNGILPDLFGFKQITWMEAWGLMILSGLLFKSSVTVSE